MQRDCDDFFKTLSRFYDHNPFNLAAKLMGLESAFTDEKIIIDCDQTE